MFDVIPISGGGFSYVDVTLGVTAHDYLKQLKDRMAPGMTEAVGLDICISVAAGLSSAHQKNNPYLKVFPSNIVIPKLSDGATLDFTRAYLVGLAGRSDSFSPEQAPPGFMSPEQCLAIQGIQGFSEVDKASDVFSLGATLYSLLCGQPPFSGMTVEDVFSATVSDRAEKIRTWRPDVSRATARLIEICLEKNPSQRFVDASIVLKALQVASQCIEGDVEIQTVALSHIETLKNTADLEAQLLPSIHTETPAKRGTDIFDDLLNNNTVLSSEGDVVAFEADAERAQKTNHVVQPIQFPAESLAPDWIDPSVSVSDSVELNEATNVTSEVAPTSGRFSSILLWAAMFLMMCGATIWYLGDPIPAATVTEAQKQERNVAVEKKSEPPPVPTVAPSPPVQPVPPEVAVSRKDAVKVKAPILENVESETPAKFEIVLSNLQSSQLQKEKEATEVAERAEAAQKVADELAVQKVQTEKLAEKKRLDKEAAEVAAKAHEQKVAEERKELEVQKLAEEQRVAAKRAAAEKETALKNSQAAKVEESRIKAAQLAETQRSLDAKKLADAAASAAKNDVAEHVDLSKKAVPTPPKVFPVDTAKEVTLDLGDGMKMVFVRVSGGTFTMGTSREELVALCQTHGADTKDYQDEIPTREMTLKNYYIAKTPVTVEQFRRFVKDSGYTTSAERAGAAFVLKDRKWQKVDNACWKNPGFEQKEDHPVVMLSYRDSEVFSAWVAKVSARPVRIPSEAEWEFAARGPKNNVWPWGNTWNGKLSNHSDKRLRPYCMEDWNYSKVDDGYAFTAPVGMYKNQSECGALDMAGNVFQWCADVYEVYSPKTNAPRLEVDVDKDVKRVLRGGSFLFRPMDCRSAARRSLKPRSWSCELGLRLTFSAQ